MPSSFGKSREILKQNLIKIYEFNSSTARYEVIDFYEFNDDVFTLNSDFSSISSENGVLEGVITLKLPYTIEGQNGTTVGNYFLSKNFVEDFVVVEIFKTLYFMTSKYIKYSFDDKGIVEVTGLQFFEVFKKVLVPNNKFYFNKDFTPAHAGYDGKISYDTTNLTLVLEKIFDQSLFDKIKMPYPNAVVTIVGDWSNQAKGFSGKLKISSYFAYQLVSMELQVQTLFEVIEHLNQKYDFNMYFVFEMKDGLIDIILKDPIVYDFSIFDDYSNLEIAEEINEDRINNHITLYHDSMYIRKLSDDRTFLPIAFEEVLNEDKYLQDDPNAKNEVLEEVYSRNNTPFLTTFIVEGLNFDVFEKISVGDKIEEKTVISKKFEWSPDSINFSLAYSKEDPFDIGDIIPDKPETGIDVVSESLWLFAKIDELSEDLAVNKDLGTFEFLGKTNKFILQAQKNSTTIEDFRRAESGIDSVGGTHDPKEDFDVVGNVVGNVLANYKSTNSAYGFSASKPNLGLLISNDEALTPSIAKSTILEYGYGDVEFGNYVIIKF